MVAEITAAELKAKLSIVTVVDIRDDESFNEGHIPGAVQLNNENLAAFAAQTDKSREVVVCCYRGNSSQGVVPVLENQGFEKVFSLKGGFESWYMVNL